MVLSEGNDLQNTEQWLPGQNWRGWQRLKSTVPRATWFTKVSSANWTMRLGTWTPAQRINLASLSILRLHACAAADWGILPLPAPSWRGEAISVALLWKIICCAIRGPEGLNPILVLPCLSRRSMPHFRRALLWIPGCQWFKNLTDS